VGLRIEVLAYRSLIAGATSDFKSQKPWQDKPRQVDRGAGPKKAALAKGAGDSQDRFASGGTDLDQGPRAGIGALMGFQPSLGSEMNGQPMASWSKIMAPMAGGAGEDTVLAAAAAIARPFGAEVAGMFAPADLADLTPWMGEGFMGGVQMAAVESLKEATSEGRRAARHTFEALAYEPKTFKVLQSPVWLALATQSRLSDVVVFDPLSARSRGPLSQAFEQIVAAEQRPVVVPRAGFDPVGHIVLAWDGGKEAARAARTALPLLQRAQAVTILTIESASPHDFDPVELKAFLDKRGVKAEVRTATGAGEPAPLLLKKAQEMGAGLLVAGAYGHPRLQQFIFGGATRSFLNADAPSLFLSH